MDPLETDWLNRGKASGNPEERIRCFEQVIKINPRNLEAAHLLGYTHLHLGNPKRAIKWFERTIEIDPKFWAAWNNMAIAYIETGKIDKALSAVNESIKINEDNPAALDTRSEIYMKLEDYKHAKRDAKDAIELLKKGKTGEAVYGEPWARLGKIYAEKGKLEKSWKYFKRALNSQGLDPRDVRWVNEEMARIKKELKKYIEKKIGKLQSFLEEVERS